MIMAVLQVLTVIPVVMLVIRVVNQVVSSVILVVIRKKSVVTRYVTRIVPAPDYFYFLIYCKTSGARARVLCMVPPFSIFHGPVIVTDATFFSMSFMLNFVS